MGPNRDKDRKAARAEHQTAGKSGAARRPVKGKPPQRRVDDALDTTASAASHGDEPSLEGSAPLPREDRAG